MNLSNESVDRPYDVVVWGATGFTGRLVVQYLAENYPPGDPLRWAVAGRNRDKLDKLVDTLPLTDSKPTVLVANSHDPQSMLELAAITRVVLTTVGPYAKYGSELVAACVESGTHYCDLCGESQWIRKMIDAHHDAAKERGARIVMCCGFDSIPSDIGVHYLQGIAQSQHGQHCRKITLLVRAMKGGASGGTFASMLNAIEEARSDKSVIKILVDPYGLNPANERSGPDGRDQNSAVFDATAGVWTAPFVMAAINTRVVRRSHALSGYEYGKDFQYNEATIAGPGIGGRLKAVLMSFSLKLFVLASAISFTRKHLVRRLLPKPGEGPSAEQRENGFYSLKLTGQLPDGTLLRMSIKGDRDPGYGSTSKMLAESAICLAKDNLGTDGGCLTPAFAMGDQLLPRLQANAGLTFELESSE